MLTWLAIFFPLLVEFVTPSQLGELLDYLPVPLDLYLSIDRELPAGVAPLIIGVGADLTCESDPHDLCSRYPEARWIVPGPSVSYCIDCDWYFLPGDIREWLLLHAILVARDSQFWSSRDMLIRSSFVSAEIALDLNVGCADSTSPSCVDTRSGCYEVRRRVTRKVGCVIRGGPTKVIGQFCEHGKVARHDWAPLNLGASSTVARHLGQQAWLRATSENVASLCYVLCRGR